jgi:hypothetical protein
MESVPSLSTKARYDKLSVMTCLVLVWFHAQAAAAFWSFTWTHAFIALGLYWVAGGLGISLGYHRLHTHRGFKTFKWFEYFLAVCGTLTLEGGPMFWVATHRLQFRLAPNELIGFPQILHAKDVDALDHGGFARVRRRYDDRAFPPPPRFERDRQHALDRAHRAIERELADKTETVEWVALDFFRGRDHAEGDRQIEARTFLFDIGRREIDRGAPARPKIAAVADRGRDPIAAFFHCRIRQSHDHDVRIAVRGVNLDLDFVSIDTEDGGGVDPGEHEARLAEDFAEVQARVRGFFVAS